jgi:hypothetical protein
MRANEETEQGRAEQGAAGGARGELRRTLRLSYPGYPLHTQTQNERRGASALSRSLSDCWLVHPKR